MDARVSSNLFYYMDYTSSSSSGGIVDVYASIIASTAAPVAITCYVLS